MNWIWKGWDFFNEGYRCGFFFGNGSKMRSRLVPLHQEVSLLTLVGLCRWTNESTLPSLLNPYTKELSSLALAITWERIPSSQSPFVTKPYSNRVTSLLTTRRNGHPISNQSLPHGLSSWLDLNFRIAFFVLLPCAMGLCALVPVPVPDPTPGSHCSRHLSP